MQESVNEDRHMSNKRADSIWYQTNLDIFLNRWFSTYEEARESLETHGGYLLEQE